MATSDLEIEINTAINDIDEVIREIKQTMALQEPRHFLPSQNPLELVFESDFMDRLSWLAFDLNLRRQRLVRIRDGLPVDNNVNEPAELETHDPQSSRRGISIRARL